MTDPECAVHGDGGRCGALQPHRICPLARGGGGTHRIIMCARAHAAVHELLDEIEAYARTSPFSTVEEIIATLPPPVWYRYGRMERLIAYRGWGMYGRSFLDGQYARHYQRWRTDGTPKLVGVLPYGERGQVGGGRLDD